MSFDIPISLSLSGDRLIAIKDRHNFNTKVTSFTRIIESNGQTAMVCSQIRRRISANAQNGENPWRGNQKLKRKEKNGSEEQENRREIPVAYTDHA